jgi:hypothetical protein
VLKRYTHQRGRQNNSLQYKRNLAVSRSLPGNGTRESQVALGSSQVMEVGEEPGNAAVKNHPA